MIKKHNKYENVIQQQKKIMEKEITGQMNDQNVRKRKQFRRKK